jgi:hypothetical protein
LHLRGRLTPFDAGACASLQGPKPVSDDDDIAIAYGTQQKVIELTDDPVANLT